MSEVQHVDFGKKRREMERMMFRLLDIAERQKADLIADPVRFYKRAVDEIVALQQHIEDLEEAARYPLDICVSALPPAFQPMPPPVMVTREDYDRMQRVMAVIQRGVVRPNQQQKSGGQPSEESGGAVSFSDEPPKS